VAVLLTLIKIGIVVSAVLLVVAYLIWVERRTCAFIQDRLGPNRVGWQGLLQPLADGVKLFMKEEVVPAAADKALFVLAPFIALFTTVLGMAVVPFGPVDPDKPAAVQCIIAPGIDIGILYVFAVGSLAVYAVTLGGWSSNNKYAFFGAMRSSAQVVSYEIPLGLSIIGVVLIAGSLNLERIVTAQVDRVWFIFYQPVGFLLFFTAALAECNRLPFDLPETEQELVSGYNTEYSAMKWALFFFGEYTHIVTISLLVVALFLGGWDLPWVLGKGWTGRPVIDFLLGTAKVVVFAVKAFLIIMVMIWIRWTLPRFRFDQLMRVAWKGLVQIALANLLVTAVVVQLMG